MIRSMTAYARREIKGSWGSATWELRSVNQRYLETYFRMPEQFRSLEPVVRERIRARLTRGKVECNLRFEPDASAQGELILNEKLAKQLVNAANWVKMQSDEGEINPVDILRWPGVMAAGEQDLDAITAEILGALDGALDDFIAARETEGQALKVLIEQRLEGVSGEVVKVRSHMPEILQWQRERLVAKLEDAEVQLENNRLEQELVLMAQRIDVSEELDRLEAHVKETYNILKKKEAVGRRLDFMMQEFNRESNTLASKSINADVTKSAIELKVLIEQMREQIQNIE
ncbi:MAG: YicC/YloC family endoribonuclease [Leclercia sp.]